MIEILQIVLVRKTGGGVPTKLRSYGLKTPFSHQRDFSSISENYAYTANKIMGVLLCFETGSGVAQASFKLRIFLLAPPECWDSKHTLPHPVLCRDGDLI